MKKLKQLCLLAIPLLLVVFAVTQWQEHRKIRKMQNNGFCAKDAIGEIWKAQLTYGQSKFYNFKELAKISNNKTIKSLAESENSDGIAMKNGYYFCMYVLQQKDKSQNIYLFRPRDDVPDDYNFICYAWPIKYKETGYSTYAIDSWGEYLIIHGAKYFKTKPDFDAIFSKYSGRVDYNKGWAMVSDGWYNHYQRKKVANIIVISYRFSLTNSHYILQFIKNNISKPCSNQQDLFNNSLKTNLLLGITGNYPMCTSPC